jgi:ribosomal protein L11 methyltransferase
MIYTQYQIDCKTELNEVILAYIGEIDGLDMFEETSTGINAFANSGHNSVEVAASLTEICGQFDATFTVTEAESVNWNEAWESHFPKVIIDQFCCVRAEFHEPEPNVVHDIVIQPKMSFGTGHHQTTRMMLSAMREVDFRGKTVFDFGCGTGVLAILAAKLGAVKILGVDNEEPAYLNSVENCARNGFSEIEIVHGVLADIPNQEYDFILANINRNIILQSLNRLHTMSRPGTFLFTSGFLIHDQEILVAEANKHGFLVDSQYQIEDWICIVFKRT